MRTKMIVASWRLDDAAYRAEVAQATGPVDRDRQTEIPVGEITPAARLLLLEIGGGYYGGRLSDAERALVQCGDRAVAPTAAEVSAILERLHAEQVVQVRKEAEAKAAKHAERVANLEQLLARLEADPMIGVNKAGQWTTWEIGFDAHGDGHNWPEPMRPRLAAVRARAEAEIARKAKAEAERQRSIDHDLGLWAAEHGGILSPEIARAAREGRRVQAAVIEAVERRVTDALRANVRILWRNDDTPQFLPIWREWILREVDQEEERDDVPTAEAYALLDSVTAAKGAISEAAALPQVAVVVGPIARFDVGTGKNILWRTGVKVTVDHPWIGEHEWFLLSEPIEEE